MRRQLPRSFPLVSCERASLCDRRWFSESHSSVKASDGDAVGFDDEGRGCCGLGLRGYIFHLVRDQHPRLDIYSDILLELGGAEKAGCERIQLPLDITFLVTGRPHCIHIYARHVDGIDLSSHHDP